MVNLRRLHVPVVKPLLKLACLADLVRRQPGAPRGQLAAESLVTAKNLAGTNRMIEEIADDLHVHRGPGQTCPPKGCEFSGEADGQVTSQ